MWDKAISSHTFFFYKLSPGDCEGKAKSVRMKMIRMIGMAMMAVLMGISLASCSKDENPEKSEEGVVVNEKKLVKMDNGDGWKLIVKYDDKGRAIEITSETQNWCISSYRYTWGENIIMAIYEYSNTDNRHETNSYTFTLENGLVQKKTDNKGDIAFKYNASNRLVEYGDKESYIWDGDKLMAYNDFDRGYEYVKTYTYGTPCKKGYNLMIIDESYLDPLFLAHPELVGMRTKQIPSTCTFSPIGSGYNNSKTETDTHTYEFDKDGYVSKYTESNSYTNNYTWE